MTSKEEIEKASQSMRIARLVLAAPDMYDALCVVVDKIESCDEMPSEWREIHAMCIDAVAIADGA